MKYLISVFSAFFLALTLLATAGCASTPKTEGTGEYLDDSVVTTKVKAALVKDNEVSAADVNVETFKGIVQLSGFVKSRAEMNRAIEVARGVSGVKSVKNAMQLR